MCSGPADTYPRLLGDIGGTHARFALVAHAGAAISHPATLRCADYAGPLDAIRAYLAGIATPAPRHAALGIANPVTGDQLHLTNSAWAFSIRTLRHDLALDHLLCVNDFTALALALPHLGPDALRQIGGGTSQAGSIRGVIGPGTGLGVSALIPAGVSQIPLDGEGGHVSLAPVTDEELRLTALLARRFGHVSAERILSGPGLVVLYQALAQLRDQPAAHLDMAAITAAALAGSDTLCEATLSTFCALLGSTAGDLALTLGARGGIFIGGGIVPQLGDYFARSPFRARFEAKGRFADYLARIPTYVITAPHPALIGAAVALDQSIACGPRHDDWCLKTSDWGMRSGFSSATA